MLRKDNIRFGLILGILAPILGLTIYYFLKFFPTYSVSEFLNYFIRQKSVITAIGSLCLLANVALFTVYINNRRDQTAKGIFAVTLIYGIGILLVKLVL